MSIHIFDQKTSPSSQSGTKSMSKHFNHFYQNIYLATHQSPLYTPNVTFENLTIDHVTDDLIGHFTNYLVDATNLNNGTKKDTLSYQTISNYASSFKINLQKRFSKGPPSPLLLDAQYRLYTNLMRSQKTKQCIKNNKPIFGSHAAASDADVKALTAIAFWSNTVEDSEFFLLMSTMISNCARGSEVST